MQRRFTPINCSFKSVPAKVDAALAGLDEIDLFAGTKSHVANKHVAVFAVKRYPPGIAKTGKKHFADRVRIAVVGVWITWRNCKIAIRIRRIIIAANIDPR